LVGAALAPAQQAFGFNLGKGRGSCLNARTARTRVLPRTHVRPERNQVALAPVATWPLRRRARPSVKRRAITPRACPREAVVA